MICSGLMVLDSVSTLHIAQHDFCCWRIGWIISSDNCVLGLLRFAMHRLSVLSIIVPSQFIGMSLYMGGRSQGSRAVELRGWRRGVGTSWPRSEDVDSRCQRTQWGRKWMALRGIPADHTSHAGLCPFYENAQGAFERHIPAWKGNTRKGAYS